MPIITTLPSWSHLVGADYSNEVFALTIWSNILHWRKYKWISQQELAKKANITQASVSEIENGDGNPTIETIGKIAHALKIKIEMITKNCVVWKMLEAIDYMTQTIKDIDVLKAMKLLYFADYESHKSQGVKVIGLQYVRWMRGPFNQDIYQLNDVFDKENDKYLPANFKTYLSLTLSDQKFLDKIIKHYGKFKSADLMNLSYKTEPMKPFKIGDNKGMWKIVL